MVKRQQQRAPAGGLRLGGKTYREGTFLPMRYARIRPNGEVQHDPADGVPEAPPNFGRPPIPHVLTFQGIISTVAQVYRNPDAAMRHNRENALVMRQDCSVYGPLEARKRAVALLNWHLEPEDAKSPLQKALADDLTKIIKETPFFTRYRETLQEALWFGRYGFEHVYGFDYHTGRKRTVITKTIPIHGDKLVFRYDDGSGKHDPDQVGIRMIQFMTKDVIAGDRKLEATEAGMAYFFEPWEREQMCIHRHMIEDAAFEDPLSAGSIHGVGIRSRIYWTWFQMTETLGMLMDFMQRSGQGIWIYRYPDGNDNGKKRVEETARRMTNDNIIIMPCQPGNPEEDPYSIQRVEVNTAGAEILKNIVHELFWRRIIRYILGQELSTESQSLGLGGGGADLQKNSLYSIIRYDSANLEETLSRELVLPLKTFNYPAAKNITVRFKIDTESDDAERKLASVQAAWNMGARIKESDVLDEIGFSAPTEDDVTLQNPAIAQQRRLWEQTHAQAQGSGPMPGDQPETDDPNQMSVDDLFGPLANPEVATPEVSGKKYARKRYKLTEGAEPLPTPTAPGLPGQPAGQHQVGETKVGSSGQELTFAPTHRWRNANKPEEGGEQQAGGDDGGDQPKPWRDPSGLKQRQQLATKNVGQVDAKVGGLMRAFQSSPDFAKGGEYWSKDVHPESHQQTYGWLQQNIGKEAGGGRVVDLGDGRLGFSSNAGAVVLSRDGKATYTVNTRLMHATSKLHGGESPEGDATPGQPQDNPPIPSRAGGESDAATADTAGAIQHDGPEPPEPTDYEEQSRSLADRGAVTNSMTAEEARAEQRATSQAALGEPREAATAATEQETPAPPPESPEEANFRQGAEAVISGKNPKAPRQRRSRSNEQAAAEAEEAGMPWRDIRSKFFGDSDEAYDRWRSGDRPIRDSGGTAEQPVQVGPQTRSEIPAATPPLPNPKAPPIAAPEAHEMTRHAFREAGNNPTEHKRHIKKALAEGKEVPADVLMDYPEIMRSIATERPKGRSEQEAINETMGVGPKAAEEPLADPESIDAAKLRETAKTAKKRLNRAVNNHAKLVREGGDPKAIRAWSKKVKELRAQHRDADKSAGEAEKEASRQQAGKPTSGAAEGFSPDEIDKLKKIGFSEENISQMNPKTKAKALKPAPTPHSVRIQKIEGQKGIATRMAEAGLTSHEADQAAIRKAIDAGHIETPQELSRVLATAKKIIGRTGKTNPSPEEQSEALQTALRRRTKRAAADTRPESQVFEEAAEEFAVDPRELGDTAKEIVRQKSEQTGEHAAAYKEAVKRTGLNERTANRLEDQGGDSSKLDEALARELAKQYPGLGWGAPNDEEDTGGAGKDSTDYAAKLLDFIKAGPPQMPRATDEDVLREAAKEIDRNLRTNKRRNPGDEEGDWHEHATEPAEREGMESLPFAKHKPGKGQGGFTWNEQDHPRGASGTAEGGQFVPKEGDHVAHLDSNSNRSWGVVRELLKGAFGEQRAKVDWLPDHPGSPFPVPVEQLSPDHGGVVKNSLKQGGEDFSLSNPKPKDKPDNFGGNDKTKQRKLLSGLDVLPGQMDLIGGLDKEEGNSVDTGESADKMSSIAASTGRADLSNASSPATGDEEMEPSKVEQFAGEHSDPDGYKVVVSGNKVRVSKSGKSSEYDLYQPNEIVPKPVAEALRKIGANPADFFTVGGMPIRKTARPLIDEAFAAKEKVSQEKADAKAGSLRTAVPGIDEVRAALRDENRYRREFDRMMNNGDNDGARPPKKPTSSYADLKARYPRAALYLAAEGYEDASHWAKSKAGKEAKRILIDGGSEDAARAKLENWLEDNGVTVD